jgi:hypothetical protein
VRLASSLEAELVRVPIRAYLRLPLSPPVGDGCRAAAPSRPLRRQRVTGTGLIRLQTAKP